MAHDSARLAVDTAGATLAGGLGISVVHTMGRVSAENGYSWFGTQRATLVPYVLSMLLSAFLLARASTQLTGPTRRLLRICAPCLVVLTLSPYSVNSTFNAVHMTVGSLLFVAQLAWTLWVALQRRDRRDTTGFTIEFVGGAICFTSVLGYDSGMLIGQIVFQTAFFTVLARSISRTRVSPASVPYRHSAQMPRPATATGLPADGGPAPRSCPPS